MENNEESEVEHKASFDEKGNVYKVEGDYNYSNHKIVSMIPGDLWVAGCYLLYLFGGFYG